MKYGVSYRESDEVKNGGGEGRKAGVEEGGRREEEDSGQKDVDEVIRSSEEKGNATWGDALERRITPVVKESDLERSEI